MPFSESVKNYANWKADYRCCLCHKNFTEVHHIIPEAEGGPDILENAAPLCASCHDLFGGNPEKRKKIRQKRDAWWQMMEERRALITDPSEPNPPYEVETNPHFENELSKSKVIIYHKVDRKNGFYEAAETLRSLIYASQLEQPNKQRWMFLEIEGHRLRSGHFKPDMHELQANFLGTFLIRYLARLYCPLFELINPNAQQNDVPELIKIYEAIDATTINDSIDVGLQEIWVADKCASIRLPKTARQKVTKKG